VPEAARVNPITSNIPAVPVEPSHDEWAEPLSGGNRHHVVPERDLASAHIGAPHRQHLMRRHAEHVAEAEHDRESEKIQAGSGPGPEPGGGQQDQRGADPGCLAVVAAVDEAAERHRGEYRQQRKARRYDAEPHDWKIELDGPVGGGHPDDADDRVHHNGVGQEWGEQAPIDVGGSGAGG
jgi:hypothetical protein